MRDPAGRVIRRSTSELFAERGPEVTRISEDTLDGTFHATIEDGRRATRRRVDGTVPGQWPIIETRPDGSHVITSYEAGRLARTTRYDSEGTAISWVAQEYDTASRLRKSIDSRVGATTMHYDENGRRWKVSAPHPQTGFDAKGASDTIVSGSI